MKKRFAIVAVIVLLITAGAVALSGGGSSAATAGGGLHCVKIGGLKWCYHSTVDQVTESVSSISALTNTPGGPPPEIVNGVQKIVFNTPSVPGGQTTCVNQNDGTFLCQ